MSALLQAAIACDRYLFIVHPFKYQRHVTSGRAIGCCVAIFVLSISLPAFILTNGESYRLEKPTRTCIQSNIWPVLFLTIVLLPSVSLAAFSSQRVWVLYSHMLQQIIQECTPTPLICLDTKIDEAPPTELQRHRRKTLRRVIKAIIMRNRALKKQKITPQSYVSKTDVNAPAPTVMITICEKGDGAPCSERKNSVSYKHIDLGKSSPGWSLPPVDTPVCTIPTPVAYGRSSIDRNTSPWSSCSTPGQISRSASPAEKSPRYLSPYSYKSRRLSTGSEDSSRSRPSSAYSDSSVWCPSSETIGCGNSSSSDMGPWPSSSNQSTCSIKSERGRQSVNSVLTVDSLPLPEGSSPSSALFSALMIRPEIFLVHSARSSKSIYSSRKERKLTTEALHWASVGNPVIAWIMSLQSDRSFDLSPRNNAPPRHDGPSPTISSEHLGQSKGEDEMNSPSFWSKAKKELTAKSSKIKALLLLWGPLFLIVVSFLPFSVALITWKSGLRTHLTSACVYVVCFLTYTIVPSLASLLLCLTNKPYRTILLKYLCCIKKTGQRK